MSKIHPTAIISSSAKIGSNTEISPFAVISENVVIGDNCKIGPNACIYEGARIGNNVTIYQGASISNTPQDLKYANEESELFIGDNTVIREFVTLHRGTVATRKTAIGSNCLLMAYCHVAHDCSIGNGVIIGNAVQIAGHVEVEDQVIIGGLSAVHQFDRIGKHCMIGGGSMVNTDVPPFLMTSGYPARYMGLNIVGLKRRGFSIQEIEEIKGAYHIYYNGGLTSQDAKSKIKDSFPSSPYIQMILDFMSKSTRNIIRK